MSNGLWIKWYLRFALVCNFTQSTKVVSYWFFGHPNGSIFKGQAIQEYGTDMLSRNVGTEPPFYAAQNPKGAQISFTLRRKPEIKQMVFVLEMQTPYACTVPRQPWIWHWTWYLKNVHEMPVELEESTVQVRWKSGEEFVTVLKGNTIHVRFISEWWFCWAKCQCP